MHSHPNGLFGRALRRPQSETCMQRIRWAFTISIFATVAMRLEYRIRYLDRLVAQLQSVGTGTNSFITASLRRRFRGTSVGISPRGVAAAIIGTAHVPLFKRAAPKASQAAACPGHPVS